MLSLVIPIVEYVVVLNERTSRIPPSSVTRNSTIGVTTTWSSVTTNPWSSSISSTLGRNTEFDCPMVVLPPSIRFSTVSSSPMSWNLPDSDTRSAPLLEVSTRTTSLSPSRSKNDVDLVLTRSRYSPDTSVLASTATVAAVVVTILVVVTAMLPDAGADVGRCVVSDGFVRPSSVMLILNSVDVGRPTTVHALLSEDSAIPASVTDEPAWTRGSLDVT